jgi:hypothetical protein
MPTKASELMKQYPCLSAASVGIMLVMDMMGEKIGGEEASVLLFQETTENMRKGVVVGNNGLQATLEKLKCEKTNMGAGISPAGQIANIQEELSTWGKFLKFLKSLLLIIVIITLTVILNAIIPGLGSILALAILSYVMFGQAIMELLINAGAIDRQNAVVEFLQEWGEMLNPAVIFLDFVISLTIEGLHAAGAIDDEQYERGMALSSMIAGILFTVIVLVASIAISVLSGGAASGTTAATTAKLAADIAQIAATVVMAIVTITNGVYTILRGIEMIHNAKVMEEVSKIKAFLESLEKSLQTIMETLNTMVENLNNDVEVMGSEFSRMSDMVSREGDINLGIARRVTI